MAKTLVQQGVKSTNNSLKGHTMILSHINYFNFIHNNRKANKITLTNHFFSIKLAKKKIKSLATQCIGKAVQYSHSLLVEAQILQPLC
jgi:hypothetical protein